MSLTKENTRKVAGLARLRMDDAQLEIYTQKLNNILGFIAQLNEVNTDNVEPLPSPVNINLTLRPDVVNDGNCQDKVLANAPEAVEGFYVVPKVVE